MNGIVRTFATTFALLMAAGCASLESDGFSKGSREEGREDLARTESLSTSHLRDTLARGNYGIASEDVRVQYSFIDDLHMRHTRFQQTAEGLPVFGGEAIVHLDEYWALFAITDNFVRNVRVEGSTFPMLSKSDAVDIAIDDCGCGEYWTAPPSAEMWILRHEGHDRIVYQISLHREDGTNEATLPVSFVDAHSGEVLWRYDNLQSAIGYSLYSGTVSFNTVFKGGTNYLEDTGRRIGVFDSRNASAETYRYTDVNNVWDTASQAPGVDAAYAMSKFVDYMRIVHGRDGIDGTGGPVLYTSVDGTTGLISAKARYGTDLNNAYWSTNVALFGSGDGVQSGPWVSLDLVGHELMHGVTQFSAGLVYSNESGALNEAISDIFGSLLEHWVRGPTAGTWSFGEELWTPGTPGDILRSLSEPHTSVNYGYTANDNPDHYSERYTGSGDSGGVHINSGIASKAFYLLANGGSHHLGGSMVGVGIDAAAQIWYRALVTYMTSGTTFADARVATLNAAAAIYGSGSSQFNAVATSWSLCGVN